MTTSRRIALFGMAAGLVFGITACGKEQQTTQKPASDAQTAQSQSRGATGAGASFPAPLYAKWASDYATATGTKINYQSVGSSAGMKQIEAKNG